MNQTPNPQPSMAVPASEVEHLLISAPSNNQPLVTIRPDGTLEFGPDYEPDAAARVFWEAVQRVARPLPAASAVVSPPTNRAGWAAAADHLIALRDSLITDPEITGKYLAGLERAARELRRLAVEAHDTGTQQQEAPASRLSGQHADALWDAIAPPGPDRPSYPVQHERVCRVVADIVDEVTAGGGAQQPDSEAPTADRPAVLREIATTLDQLAETDVIRKRRSLATARRLLAVELRRMADEPAPVAQQQPEPDAEDAGEALARYINEQPISVIQRAVRILGWGWMVFEFREELAAGQQQAAAADDEETPTTWTPGPVAVGRAADWTRSRTCALLATPCDACEHTLNWHRNDVGCTVPDCVCSRFREPVTP